MPGAFNDPCLVRGKYLEVYNKAFLDAEITFSKAGIDVHVKSIDGRVIDDWKGSWAGRAKVKDSFDWSDLYRRYRRRCKRLDVAIYYEGKLAILVLGRVTRGRKVVRVDYMQKSPLSIPKLKGLSARLVTLVVMKIAEEIGASHVAMVNPVNDIVSNHYLALGFTYKKIYGRTVRKTMYKEV